MPLAETCNGFGIVLTGAPGNEEITYTHTEKLGLCGPYAPMETISSPGTHCVYYKAE